MTVSTATPQSIDARREALGLSTPELAQLIGLGHPSRLWHLLHPDTEGDVETLARCEAAMAEVAAVRG